MADFSADWLALREPADMAARSSRVTRAIADALWSDRVLDVVDLAAGTGSNVRYLAERLPVQQLWLLVDHDAVLLEQLPERMSSWGTARGYEVIREQDELLLRGDHLMCRLATRQLDLNLIDDDNLLAGHGLITASAFLDLVSERWLRALAARCRQSNAAVLFALTYDGRIGCSPPEPEDEVIRELVNRHQQTDKGFGEAAGPDATDRLQEYLVSLGYLVRREPSDWVLPPDTRELQRELIEGWARAAAAIAPAQWSSIRNWRTRRIAHVEGRCSRLVVGHADLGAWLPDSFR